MYIYMYCKLCNFFHVYRVYLDGITIIQVLSHPAIGSYTTFAMCSILLF